ncbi:MAG: nitrilase-related carbon-nitrogen hydrolase [Spirosomataceae bacterium]
MKKLLGVLILLWLSYLVWASWGKEDLNPPADTTFRIEDEFGTNQGKGNLIGIQPYMMPIDYANEKAFFNKMNGYFEQLKEKQWLSAKSIVVLPEYLGTWLVTAHEKSSLYAANSLGKGLQVMVSSHLFSFGKEYLFAPEQIKDKTKYAVFALKADEMASIYQKTFSDLARRYGVTIVAGSILLPDPRVEAGQLVVGKGELYNISGVFRPDGSLAPTLVKKLFPITDELPFVCPGKPDDLPVFDTPAGKLGVLVCADVWNAAAFQALKKKGAQLLAVPSYSTIDNVWSVQWEGYSGTPTPAYAQADVGKITEGQAWFKYTMGKHAKAEAGISKGMNVFLRGKLWDLGSDGRTLILNDSLRVAKGFDGPGVSCLWI